MILPTALGVVLALAGGAEIPPLAPAAKPAAAGDLTGKFVVVSRKNNGDTSADLLRRVEPRRVGGRDFLVGEYCVNPKLGVGEEWEGVQLWVPVDQIESIMVFATEDKAWRIVKSHSTLREKD